MSRVANKRTRRKVDPERGTALFIALLVLTGLLGLAALSVAKVKRGIRSNSQSQFHSIALFSAESGISAGIDFLRVNAVPLTYYSTLVSANNTTIQTPVGIAGNTIVAGAPGNLFDPGSDMSYVVSVRNNSEDPGFALGNDSDGIVLLHSIGRGPDSTKVAVEVMVQKTTAVATLKILSWRIL